MLTGIDHFDVHSFEGDATLEQFIAKMFTSPWWVRALYKAHAVFATLLGLPSDDLGQVTLNPQSLDLQPGRCVTFFRTLASEAGSYWVGGYEDDPHLSAWIVITAPATNDGRTRFRVATIVHYKDWRGPLFMKAILPFHHLIVWACGRRAARAPSCSSGHREAVCQ